MRKVFYHAGCADGFCAAWAVRRGNPDIPDDNFIPVAYGDPTPDVTGDDVIVVDFAWDPGKVARLAESARSFLLLDHHKTHAAELASLPWCVIDVEHSGARLAWDHAGPGGEPPWLVHYVEDRDLWAWRLPDSNAINAAIQSYAFDFGVWDKLHDLGPNRVKAEGEAILRHRDKQVHRAAENGRPIRYGDLRGIAVNTPLYQSEVGNLIAKRPGVDFVALWADVGDGRYLVSLRSAGDVDVSEIAKAHGGGGHAKAAGFKTVGLPAWLRFQA